MESVGATNGNVDINELVSQSRFQESITNEITPNLQGIYNFVDSPWNNSVADTRNVELGGLAIESEKTLNTSKIEKVDETDKTIDEIASHISVMAERAVVFHMFWGVVKKTQTEFKNMARGQ